MTAMTAMPSTAAPQRSSRLSVSGIPGMGTVGDPDLPPHTGGPVTTRR